MGVGRRVAALAAVITAFAGLSLVTAGPAAAAEAGYWRAYGNTNPITSSPAEWSCARSKAIATDVLAQVCAVRSPNEVYVQGAVIVRNNRSSLFSTSAAMTVFSGEPRPLGDWVCSSSGVGARSWSVCFGRSFVFRPAVLASGEAKGVDLGVSPYV
jgi:hypothetical protein